MAVSLDSALDNDAIKRMSTRRSSILPSLEEAQNVAGNFATKFSMSSFVKKVEELTHEQRTAVESVGFGNLLKIHHHTLRKNLLVEWMERWDCEKRTFLLLGRELTIAPIDATLILGLRVSGKPVSLNEDEPFSALEQEYGATKDNRKINVSAIEHRLESLGDLANEDFVRTFLLFTFGTLLFPNSTGKIDSCYLSFLKDLDKVPEYAWGVAVIEDLFSCLSRKKEEQVKNIEGCLILLQIWSYEHIDIGRPNQLNETCGFPRACCWESSRCTSQRRWFTTKFNEVEENQVTWKLEPKTAELHVDVIRELLDAEMDAKGVCTLKHSSPLAVGVSIATSSTTKTSTRCPWRPPKSSCQMAVLDEESIGDRGKGKHLQDDILENSWLSTDMSEITVEFPECSSSFNVQNIQDDQRAAKKSLHVKEDYRILKTEYSRLEKEMAKLKRENTMLRNKLSVVPKLEEEIARLTKEAADLKESQHLKSQTEVVHRLERLILEYFDEDALQ